MSKAAIKTNNDASMLESKIQLRFSSLPDKEEINVLEAFGGEGILWKYVQSRTTKKIHILSIDKNKYNRVQLQGDNIKFLTAIDLSNFDIIDLDAWGSPSNQLDILLNRNYTGIVHCTFIQTMQGGLSYNILFSNGYTKRMIRKCPSLFSKNGLQNFLCYLANKGVKQVHVISKSRKNYLWFSLAK